MSEAPAGADRGYPAPHGFDAATMKWLSAIVAGLGLWLAVSPFLYGASVAMTAVDLVVGVGILVAAGKNVTRMWNDGVASTEGALLVVLFAQWAIVAPFVFPFEPFALVTSNVASGVLAAVLAAYTAYESRRARSAMGADAWP